MILRVPEEQINGEFRCVFKATGDRVSGDAIFQAHLDSAVGRVQEKLMLKSFHYDGKRCIQGSQCK